MATTLYTIGFTRCSAADFFGRLREAGVRRLLDVRRNNSSQLAGFSKAGDLAYFLDEILGAAYDHRLDLAPTADLVRDYRKGHIDFAAFAERFTGQITERAIERADRAPFEGPTVLLCSEPIADRCHRRLVAEHLAEQWGGIDIVHL